MGTFAETSIVENRLSFAVFHFSKRTEVSRFRFPFAATKRKLPFSVSSVFCLLNSGNMETGTCRHEDMETWGHGDIETWIHGDLETRRHGDLETWRLGDICIDGEIET
jgi:hypothetical protein